MIHIKEQKNGIISQPDTELFDKSYFNILDFPNFKEVTVSEYTFLPFYIVSQFTFKLT